MFAWIKGQNFKNWGIFLKSSILSPLRVDTLSCLETSGNTLSYFGFASNEIPDYGSLPTLTYFIFNPPVMREPGTKQTGSQPNAPLLTPAKPAFFRLFFKHFPFCYQKECAIYNFFLPQNFLNLQIQLPERSFFICTFSSLKDRACNWAKKI